ncbi:Bro-N domain-containing protein [Clostridioides difficile]|uniref:BRO-N domain-containing protein n=1 Tax=Clostridioides difficile TaxID=1496 RepID=UPI00235676D5|nr:BRO family protein [Clostridioides difficile]
MSNNLQIFKNNDFGEIRTVEIDGKLYFVATDIARCLGYKDTTNAIKQHCKWVVKHHIPHPQSKTKTLK